VKEVWRMHILLHRLAEKNWIGVFKPINDAGITLPAEPV
jgi:hypothetical protein